ncbi:MAG: cation-transporting P-type ATPase [Proteobacteria bacterium]|nr:cation-transporting P-type ATPase [Pseudomonadota bacterium]
MRIQDLTEDDVPAALHSCKDGLSEHEANQRLIEYGKNVLRQRSRERPYLRLAKELSNLFAVILWAAAALSFLVAASSSDKSMNSIGLAIVLVIFINAIFSCWQTLRAEKALEELEKLLPRTARVLRDKIWSVRPADELVPGDVVRLSEGQIAAADMRLIESQSLRVDTSYLTGESIPALRNSRSDPTGESVNARNLLFAGTKLVAGSATGVVFATGGKTEFAKIADLTGSEKPLLSPLETEINITGKRIALIALAVGLVFFICSIAAGLGLKMALIFAVGIIVANIPEGLMPTMTLSLAVAAQRMAKKKSSSGT